jgi:hypothetical protein
MNMTIEKPENIKLLELGKLRLWKPRKWLFF